VASRITGDWKGIANPDRFGSVGAKSEQRASSRLGPGHQKTLTFRAHYGQQAVVVVQSGWRSCPGLVSWDKAAARAEKRLPVFLRKCCCFLGFVPFIEYLERKSFLVSRPSF